MSPSIPELAARIDRLRKGLAIAEQQYRVALLAHGITTPQTRAQQRAARHGTDGGYYAHRRTWGTDPCDPCKQAHSNAETDRKRRNRERKAAA